MASAWGSAFGLSFGASFGAIEGDGGAFQCGAFQEDAFQLDADCQVAETEQRFVPGHKKQREEHHWTPPQQRYRDEEDKRRERRERILAEYPLPIQKTLEKAARRVVNKARVQERNEPQANPLQWLLEHQAQERDALQWALKKQELEFDEAYMRALRYAVEAAVFAEQEREDAEIMLLLMEM